MNADESRSEIRRSRAVEKKVLPAGAARELRDAVYRLYAEADRPQLIELARQIAEDDDLPGAPGKDLIGKVISGDGLASQQDTVSVAVVLARAAGRQQVAPVAEQVRQLWVAAATVQPAPLQDRLGEPVDACDPLVLGVHPAIQVTGIGAGDLLPGYVPRAHDARLRTILDDLLADGRSRLVTLVGGSSTGKTRAGWELARYLEELQPGRWRLWYPFDPTHPQAALAGLDKAEPETIVWLNEAQQYLMPTAPGMGEQLAAGLRRLLADPGRRPVLVLATLWPDYWNILTTRPTGGNPDLYGQARELLTAGTKVTLTDTFSSSELAALAGPGVDARLRRAAEHAEGGRITQYLAGGPVLEDRYRTAVDTMPAPRAILQVAIDARRFGHPLALPHALLEQAASDYLDDHDWDALGEDWLESALAYTAQSCIGVRGLLTRIRARPFEPARPDGRPCYRLADYLEQLGRTERAAQFPPASFWKSVAVTVTDRDVLYIIGAQAHRRARYRHAVPLYARAANLGHEAARARLAGLRDQAAGVERPDHPPGSTPVVSDAGYGDPTLFAIAALTGTFLSGVDRKGELPAALHAADQGDPTKLIDLAGRCAGVGDRDGALEVALLAAGRGAPNLLVNMADDRARSGDPGGARDLYQQAIDHGVHSALDRLAALYEGTGENDHAQKLRRFGLNADGSLATRLDLDA
ncbi:hypothetical protein O7627_33500 [Solwaraspora sp. WMMD1047]|uniref:hypothetical protein n=1 Tax=Solwaraspora sp. WMMD1047 TaxID=3016102 RepID=UPI002415E63E|nr:hypothetical protein [Solwaraspora sp. WMMD1047]MDG4834183.1 hypothetical protein [Solwaraspora sp. WMMD1047]